MVLLPRREVFGVASLSGSSSESLESWYCRRSTKIRWRSSISSSLEVVSSFYSILLLLGGTGPLPLPLSMFPLPLPELSFRASLRASLRSFLLLMRVNWSCLVVNPLGSILVGLSRTGTIDRPDENSASVASSNWAW